jgi:hypothetical protein
MDRNSLVVPREDHCTRGVATVAVEGLLQGCGLVGIQTVRPRYARFASMTATGTPGLISRT